MSGAVHVAQYECIIQQQLLKQLSQFELNTHHFGLASKCQTVLRLFSASLGERRLSSQRLKIHRRGIHRRSMCLRLLACVLLSTSRQLLNVLIPNPNLQSRLPLSRTFFPLAFALMMIRQPLDVYHPKRNLPARYTVRRVLLPSAFLQLLMKIYHKWLLLTPLLPTRHQKKLASVTAAPRKKSQDGNKGFKTNFLISKL